MFRRCKSAIRDHRRRQEHIRKSHLLYMHKPEDLRKKESISHGTVSSRGNYHRKKRLWQYFYAATAFLFFAVRRYERMGKIG